MSAIGQPGAGRGSLTEAECVARAEKFEEHASSLPYPYLAQGFLLIANSYRLLARIESIRDRGALGMLGPPPRNV
jgi:hypothetical protein